MRKDCWRKDTFEKFFSQKAINCALKIHQSIVMLNQKLYAYILFRFTADAIVAIA